jgi:hypothetical protein
MSDDNVRDLPVGDIDFDLDALEKPVEDQIPPLRANVNGKVLEFQNPDELDWTELMLIESPADFLDYVLSDDDLTHLRKTGLKGWQLNALVERFMKHFGLDEKLKRAQTEARLEQRRR